MFPSHLSGFVFVLLPVLVRKPLPGSAALLFGVVPQLIHFPPKSPFWSHLGQLLVSFTHTGKTYATVAVVLLKLSRLVHRVTLAPDRP